jgi:hypothetical protein
VLSIGEAGGPPVPQGHIALTSAGDSDLRTIIHSRLYVYCPQDRGCGHVPNTLRANRAYATRLGQGHHTIIPP